MKKIIFSLFTIYELSSGNRLLLQTGAPVPLIPGGGTTAAPEPEPVAPAPGGGGPGGPGVGTPITPIIDIIPGGGRPVIPGQGPVTGLTDFSCGLPCSTSIDCASPCAMQTPGMQKANTLTGGVETQTALEINDPANGFVFDCLMAGSCAGSQININLSQNNRARKMEVNAESVSSMYGTTMTFNDQQGQCDPLNPTQCGGGPDVAVRVVCGAGNCNGATFVFAGGASYSDIVCEEYIGCGGGCTVIMPNDAPVSCDQVSTT